MGSASIVDSRLWVRLGLDPTFIANNSVSFRQACVNRFYGFAIVAVPGDLFPEDSRWVENGAVVFRRV